MSGSQLGKVIYGLNRDSLTTNRTERDIITSPIMTNHPFSGIIFVIEIDRDRFGTDQNIILEDWIAAITIKFFATVISFYEGRRCANGTIG